MPSFKDFEKITDFLEEQSRTFPSISTGSGFKEIY